MDEAENAPSVPLSDTVEALMLPLTFNDEMVGAEMEPPVIEPSVADIEPVASVTWASNAFLIVSLVSAFAVRKSFA